MKRQLFINIRLLVVSLFLLLLPAMVYAQAEQIKTGPPPIGQPLASEGTFAVNLASALGVATTGDEVAAESQLGDLGIAPRNGWIADYPVTPDIIVELQNAVANAADAGKLSMSKGEALKRLQDVTLGLGLPVRPYTAGTAYEPTPASCQTYPNPMVINNDYINEGPPVVTYYCPPPDYYALYAWVPSPFWWSDLWFPGFFILHDFHRVTRHHNKVVVISNHFNDIRNHRAFRVDPVERFRGRTFAGIGVSHPQRFISTGVPRSERRVFNGPAVQRVPGGRMTMPPATRGGMTSSPSSHGGGGFSGGGSRR